MTTTVRDLDPAIERVILRCLSPDPRARPASALAIAAALPGGDPLAAALAAGEMPSPEMVAAAGETEGLRPVVAFCTVGIIAAAMLTIAILGGKYDLVEKTPFENPPSALAVLAKDTLRRLGVPQHSAATHYDMDYDDGYLDYMREHQPPDRRWSHLAAGQPPPILFSYRQSPHALDPGAKLTDGWDNPQFNVPGMLRLRLDMQARLVSFESIPPQQAAGAAPPPPDWNPFFAAAGLDPARFQTAPPEWAPAMACDNRAAWIGAWPGAPEIPVRIEAASWRGQP